MSLDDQLIARNNSTNEEADNSESNASDYDNENENSSSRAANLRASKMEDRNGVEPESQGDFLADKMTKRRLNNNKESENKVAAVALSPAKQGLSKMLQSAWVNLIPSFGLTLIWIDIHIFLSQVFGKDLFCALGEEWFPKGTPRNIDGAKKSVGLGETMGVSFLNIGCLLLILAVLVLIAMMLNVVENPLASISSLLGSIWTALTGSK